MTQSLGYLSGHETFKINPRANSWIAYWGLPTDINKQAIMRSYRKNPLYSTAEQSRARPGVMHYSHLSLITLLKVWARRPWRFSRGLLFQAPCKINQSFIKVRSPHELRNQIEQCSRLLSRYCSIKLSYCWGRWLKYSLAQKTWVLRADNWKKSHKFIHVKQFFLKDSFFEVFFSSFHYSTEIFCIQEKNVQCVRLAVVVVCIFYTRHFTLYTSQILISSKKPTYS